MGDKPSRDDRGPGTDSWLIWGPVGVALVVIVGITTAKTPSPKLAHDSAIDAAFDNRLIVALTHVVLVAVLAYALVSIAVRVRRGQWVRNAGPVQTDAPTQAMVDSQEDLQEELRQAQATIKDLDKRLDRSLELNTAYEAKITELGGDASQVKIGQGEQ